MGYFLFSVQGTIRAHGNAVLSRSSARYESITIAGDDGQITRVTKVSARDPLNAYVNSHSDGELFFYRLLGFGKILYGIKTSDGVVEFLPTQNFRYYLCQTILIILALIALANKITFLAVVFAAVFVWVMVMQNIHRYGVRKNFSTKVLANEGKLKVRTV
jgi:hypothetical protein